MTTDTTPHFVTAILELLDETFDTHHGFYLDKGDSLFPTLAAISAEQASRPVSARCASVAAQVHHTTYYLNVLRQELDPAHKVDSVDWDDSWDVPPVSPAEWEAMIDRMRQAAAITVGLIRTTTDWSEDAAGAAVAMTVHTAFHLGQIRQSLCFITQA